MMMNNDNKRSVGGFGLVGDIGGINVCFVFWCGQCLEFIEVFVCVDYLWFELVVCDYLVWIGELVVNIDLVCLVCVGLVGVVDFCFINNYWVINCVVFCEELGLDYLLLVNDFSIMVWVVLWLGVDELVQVCVGSVQVDCVWLIIGFGIGFGVGSLLLLGGGCWEVLFCEGGYVDLLVILLCDFVFWQGLQVCYGYVFVECVLFGNGLFVFYEISCVLDGVVVCVSSVVEVGVLVMVGDVQVDVVLEYFFLWLVWVVGNVVFIVGVFGGVYIIGGIVLCFFECFIVSGFVEVFVSCGKISGVYLQDVLVWVMIVEYLGLFGVGVVLQQVLDVEG